MTQDLSDIYDKLPEDCREALNKGDAIIKFKYGSYCIIDTEDESLFDVLPLIGTRFGFAVCNINNGRRYNTYFHEILCRQRGIISYNNKCRLDLRKCNINIKPWDDK